MVDITSNAETYLSGRRDPSARYASFDHCFNYFQKARLTRNTESLYEGSMLQLSCLQLGFYLASWGMFRGSAKLLQHSSQALEGAVRVIADAPTSVWEADVNAYDMELSKELHAFGKHLGRHLPGGNSDTLVTKTMLGTFGCVPAFDRYFCVGFGTSGFNVKALRRLGDLYAANKATVDRYRVKTIDFEGRQTDVAYTGAKVLDMVFFTEGLEQSRKK